MKEHEAAIANSHRDSRRKSLRQYENQRLLEQINAAFEDTPETDEERSFLQAAAYHFCTLLDDERD